MAKYEMKVESTTVVGDSSDNISKEYSMMQEKPLGHDNAECVFLWNLLTIGRNGFARENIDVNRVRVGQCFNGSVNVQYILI